MSTDGPKREAISLVDFAPLLDPSRIAGDIRKACEASSAHPSDRLLSQNATGRFSRCPQTPSPPKSLE